MAQHMGKVGLFTGVVLGFFTRDQFIYTMPEKMDAINHDYVEIDKDLAQRVAKTNEDIAVMKRREKELEARYLYLKERILMEGNTEEVEQKYFKKPEQRKRNEEGSKNKKE